ncbi:hypothetical protein CsSME_00025548 [Camellia sinensis var. sinensis]
MGTCLSILTIWITREGSRRFSPRFSMRFAASTSVTSDFRRGEEGFDLPLSYCDVGIFLTPFNGFSDPTTHRFVSTWVFPVTAKTKGFLPSDVFKFLNPLDIALIKDSLEDDFPFD